MATWRAWGLWLVTSVGLLACGGSLEGVGSGDGGGTDGSAGDGGADARADGGGTDGGGVDYGACGADDDCVPIPKGCCLPCGINLALFEGVTARNADQARAAKDCAGVGCPACYPMDLGNVAARCVAGRCQVFDVREEPSLSRCDTVDDCTLRNGSRCCASCQADEWIGLRKDAESTLRAMVCPASGPTPCPKCASVPTRKPACTNHVCVVF